MPARVSGLPELTKVWDMENTGSPEEVADAIKAANIPGVSITCPKDQGTILVEIVAIEPVPTKRVYAPKPNRSISVNGKVHAQFKNETAARGERMASVLDIEIIRWLDENE